MPLSSSLLRGCGFCGVPIRGGLGAFSVIGRISPGHAWVSIQSIFAPGKHIFLCAVGVGISDRSSRQLPCGGILDPSSVLLSCPDQPCQLCPTKQSSPQEPQILYLEIQSLDFTFSLQLAQSSCCLSWNCVFCYVSVFPFRRRKWNM